MSKTVDISSFIEKATKIHFGRYSYENFNYIDSKTKSFVTCPTHGDFSICSKNLLSRKF